MLLAHSALCGAGAAIRVRLMIKEIDLVDDIGDVVIYLRVNTSTYIHSYLQVTELKHNATRK